MRWGCDAPATAALYSRSCERCFWTADPDCTLCDGGGTRDIYRCPPSQAASMGPVVEAYMLVEQHGIWPSSFEPGAQSCWFMRAQRAMRREVGRIQKAERQEAERA